MNKANFLQTSRVKWSKQAGFSLVELMISVLLGFILIMGVTEIYVNSKGTYRMTEEMTRLQENARIAFEMLAPEVRMAGYTGCANINTANEEVIAKPPGAGKPPIVFTGPEDSITGNEGGSSSWAPTLNSTLAGLTHPPLPNTDVVTIQSSVSCGGSLVDPMSLPDDPVKISASNTCKLVEDAVLIISDCSHTTVFRTDSISNEVTHPATKNTSASFQKNYKEDAEIYKSKNASYYIATGAGGHPALWQLDNGSDNPLELVEGVENMQITYGVDTSATADGVVDRYVEADAIPVGGHDWDRVIITRLSLLLRSIEPVRTDSQSYIFAGITTTDKYLRQEYTTTIQLRNRGLQP